MGTMRPDEIDRILGTALAQQLLTSSRLTRLAYTGIDGYPRVIPTGYLWKDRSFIVCTAANAPKVRALLADPRVALEVDTEGQPPHIVLVRGRASVTIVDGVPPEYLEASKKYLAPKQWQSFEDEVRRFYPQMARISIIPEWAKLIDFESTLPTAVEELAQRSRG